MKVTPGTKKRPRKRRDGLYLIGQTYYFRRMVDGKRVKVSTGCEDRRQAERRRTELDKEMNDGKFGWKPEPKKDVPTMADYLLVTAYDGYVKHMHDGGAACRRFCERLCKTFKGRRMDGLTKTDAEGYLKALSHTEQFAVNSVRSQHIAFKALWGRAIADKLVAENPWKFKMLAAVPRKRVMTYAEQARLWPLLPASVRRAATVALLAGVRNKELCHIEREDIDFVRLQIHIRAAVGKKGKERWTPLAPDAAMAIREQIAFLDDGHPGEGFDVSRLRDNPRLVFPFKRSALVNALERQVAALGIPALTIHDLRRTFGTRCAEHNVPMRVLQEWMGHAKIEMTATFYSHVDASKVSYMQAMLDASEKALAVSAPVPMVTKLVPLRAK